MNGHRDEPATKKDLTQVEKKLTGRIDQVEQGVTAKIDQVEQGLTERIERVALRW